MIRVILALETFCVLVLLYALLLSQNAAQNATLKATRSAVRAQATHIARVLQTPIPYPTTAPALHKQIRSTPP